MSPRSEQLLHDVLNLPEPERAEMAAKLIESLDGEAEPDVDEAWAAEIERRCAALDSGEAVTTDWDEVRQRIERDLFSR